jgi:hypothetical protein
MTASQDLPYQPISNEVINMAVVVRYRAQDCVMGENARFIVYVFLQTDTTKKFFS